MTTNLKFANWAKSSLATNLASASTSLVLKAGDGSKFPSSGDFYLVLRGGINQTTNEIVKATARSGDTLTIVRAQDGTTAADFYANDSVTLTIVRAIISDQTVNTSDTPAFKGLQLNTNPGFSDHAEGRIYWDNADKTPVVDMSFTGVKLQVGQENFIRVKNITGATISNGQVVYINGSSANRPTIALAQANAYITSSTVIGVATHDITTGSEGYITTTGLVRDFNTSGFTEGSVLYLSASTPGALTVTAPVSPNFNVVIGYCEKSHASQGIILVQIQNNSFAQNYFEPTITILPISKGGTGASTAATAGANILGISAPSAGKYLTNNGTDYVWADITGGFGVQSVGINNTNGGLVITNSPITSTGTITVNLKDDLLALENLSTIGYAQRIGTSSWQTVSQIPIGDINGTGTLQITNNSNVSAALTITQTGTADALLIEDQSADATPFVINHYGQVIVGHTASAPAGASWPSQIIGTTGSNGLGITQFSADANGGNITFTKSRNAIGAWGTAPASGDAIGSILFYMDKGGDIALGARISSSVDGIPSTTSTPGRLIFSTTPDGATTPFERLRIRSDGNIGFGNSGSGAASLYFAKNQTGATTTYGLLLSGQIKSDVTSAAHAYFTQLNTEDAPFSLTSFYHYRATVGAQGAASRVISQFGFVAESSLITAANNYGFLSNITDGVVRTITNVSVTGNVVTITLSASHTYLVGNTVKVLATTNTAVNGSFVVTSVTSTTFTYDLVTANIASVADTGTTWGIGRYNFYAASNAPNVFLGRLISGTSNDATIRSSNGDYPQLQLNGTSRQTSSAFLSRWNNDSSGSYIEIGKSRGATVNSYTAVALNDTLGEYRFAGTDGVDFNIASSIVGYVDGTPTTNCVPGRLSFQTTSVGQALPNEKMVILANGNVGIGVTPSYLLDVFGTAHATSVLADGFASGTSIHASAGFAASGNRTGSSQYGFLVNTTTINASAAFSAFNCSGVPDSTNADSAVYGYYGNYSARAGVNNAVYGASRWNNIVTFQLSGWTSANGWKYGNKFTVTGTTNGLDGTYILLSLTNATNTILSPSVTTSTSSTTITFSSNVTMTEGCSIYNSAGTYVGTLAKSIYSATTGTLNANAAVALTAATGCKYTGYGAMAYSVGADVGYSNGGIMYTVSNTFNFFNAGSAPNYFEYDVLVNADINLTGSLRVAGSILLSGAITNQDGGSVSLYPGTLDGNDNSHVNIGPAANTRGATVYACGNEHATYPGKIRLVPGLTAVGDDAVEIAGKTTVTSTLTHNGLVLTTGTNVDQVFTSGTITLASTTWVDVLTGSTLPTGSYYVQVYSASNADMYTGVMSWNSANSTVSSADEIVLHRAGTSSPASVATIFLQYLRQNGAVPKLQISAGGTRTDTVNIKFRRII